MHTDGPAGTDLPKEGWYWMSKKNKIIAIVVVILGIGAGWAVSYAIKKGWNRKDLQMVEE